MMAKKASSRTEDIKEKLQRPPSHLKKLNPADYLSIGSTTLNLGISGRTTGGIPKGTIAHIVGDSDSGKTVLALTTFAEACQNDAFKDYRLIFCNPEGGALMDFASFYGSRAAKRIEETKPEFLEELYYDLDDLFKAGDRFIMVVDSMDVLYPKAFEKKFQERKSQARRGKDESGDFGMQKAKINSENLRKVRSKIERNGSILQMISQTRDKVDGAGYGDTKTCAGGRVLKFYSAIQIWMSTRETLKKSVLGQQRSFGIKAQVDIKKNHVSGKKCRLYVNILNDRGIDDVGGNIDFLTLEGHWKSTAKEEGKGKITAPEFSNVEVTRDKLIRIIEQGDHERDLRKLVRKVWLEIEEALKTDRKTRYE